MRSKRWLWQCMAMIPEKIRFPLIRSLFTIDYDLPENLVFKIAETQSEIEGALKILHDGFVEQELMDENSAQMRITKYHCLPTTTVLIAKLDEEVIATITVVKDSLLRLPSDTCWDLSEIRRDGKKLVEVSGLAIKNTHRCKRGKLLFALCKYMWEYSRDYAKADALVISIAAKVRDFYHAILLFEKFSGSKTMNYSFANGITAEVLWLPFENMEARFRKVYSGTSPAKNMHHYLFEYKVKNFRFPERPFFTTSDPVMTPSLMEHLFKNCSKTYEEMPASEKQFLKQTYFYADFCSVIDQDPLDSKRKEPRFPVHCPGFMGEESSKLHHAIVVEEVSRHGMNIRLHNDSPPVGSVLQLQIQIGPSQRVRIEASVKWSREKNAGLELLVEDHRWTQLIDHLEHRLHKATILKTA